MKKLILLFFIILLPLVYVATRGVDDGMIGEKFGADEKAIQTIETFLSSEKEVIKITQEMEKVKAGKYKTIDKYEKDDLKYSVDEIVVWGGKPTPEKIGYQINVEDASGSKKSILRMDGKDEIITDWVFESQLATSTK